MDIQGGPLWSRTASFGIFGTIYGQEASEVFCKIWGPFHLISARKFKSKYESKYLVNSYKTMSANIRETRIICEPYELVLF